MKLTAPYRAAQAPQNMQVWSLLSPNPSLLGAGGLAQNGPPSMPARIGLAGRCSSQPLMHW